MYAVFNRVKKLHSIPSLLNYSKAHYHEGWFCWPFAKNLNIQSRFIRRLFLLFPSLLIETF